jgi:antitoxin component YwqK of YwqJK toxin-antitoxin module
MRLNYFAFISAVLFIPLVLCGQVKVDKKNLSKLQYEFWDKNKTVVKGVGSFYKDKVNRTTKKHGTWRYYTKDGKLEEEINYFTDSLHGRYVSFWNGKIPKQESYFYLGIPDSSYKNWNEKGVLVLDGYYDYGRKADIWYSYYDNGKPMAEEKFIAGIGLLENYWLDDSLHSQTIKKGVGSTKIFFKSGKLKEIFTVEKGLKNGAFKEYSARGALLTDGFFKNGFKDSCWTTYYNNERVEKIACYKQDTLYGEYLTYYESGLLKIHGNFTQGKKTGSWSWYTEEGQLDSEGSFDNDLQEGTWNYYFATGDLSYKAVFSKGKKEGEWEYFYSKNRPFKRGKYSNDLKEGTWKTWYETGALLMEGAYLKDKEEGVWNNYWDTGKLKNTTTFSKGKLNGLWQSFSPFGKLKVEGLYKNDLQIGKWVELYENGRPKDIINYKIIRTKSKANDLILKGRVKQLSVQHGEFVTFSNKDFQVTEEGKYRKGEKHGVWLAYHPGGRLIAVQNEYKNGKLNGLTQQFDRRGKRIQSSVYKNGRLDGPMRLYNEKGKLTKEILFKNGKRVSNDLNFRP